MLTTKNDHPVITVFYGVVLENGSFLRIPQFTGDDKWRFHSVYIYPLAGELDRQFAFIATVFGRSVKAYIEPSGSLKMSTIPTSTGKLNSFYICVILPMYYREDRLFAIQCEGGILVWVRWSIGNQLWSIGN